MNMYGQRRTFVGRMLVAAQTLSKEVLEALELYGVPNSYVYDNYYFNGNGREANKRLGEAWILAVLNMYGEETTKGQAFSLKTFDSEVCAPAKHAERWVKDRRREFGSIVEVTAFKRVEDYLQSAQARPLVLKCMRLGVRLHGEGPHSTGDQTGIDQCRILYNSLLEAMGRQAPAPGGATAGISGDAAALSDVTAEASSGSAEMLTGLEAEDTAKAAAMRKTEAANNRILRYTTFNELSGYLTRILVPSEKVIFFLDFITSKARSPLAALDDVGRFLGAHGYGAPTAHGPASAPPIKVRTFVPTGSRLDLVPVIKDKLAAVAPSLVVFFVDSDRRPGAGPQTLLFYLGRCRPSIRGNSQNPAQHRGIVDPCPQRGGHSHPLLGPQLWATVHSGASGARASRGWQGPKVRARRRPRRDQIRRRLWGRGGGGPVCPSGRYRRGGATDLRARLVAFRAAAGSLQSHSVGYCRLGGCRALRVPDLDRSPGGFARSQGPELSGPLHPRRLPRPQPCSRAKVAVGHFVQRDVHSRAQEHSAR